MDLKSRLTHESVNSIGVAESEDQRRALLNAIPNLWLPEVASTVFTSLVVIRSFCTHILKIFVLYVVFSCLLFYKSNCRESWLRYVE